MYIFFYFEKIYYIYVYIYIHMDLLGQIQGGQYNVLTIPLPYDAVARGKSSQKNKSGTFTIVVPNFHKDIMAKCSMADWMSKFLATLFLFIDSRLTAMVVTEPLLSLLSNDEKEHLLPPDAMHFAVISAFRASSACGQRDCMRVQRSLELQGIKPKWYVDAGSIDAYRALGLDAVVGGKLQPARNMALDDASRLGKPCVQMADDLTGMRYMMEHLCCILPGVKFCIFHPAKYGLLKGLPFFKVMFVAQTATVFAIQLRQGNVYKTYSTDAECNNAWKEMNVIQSSFLGAAQFIWAKMRAHGPKLGGTYCATGQSRCLRSDPFTYKHFIMGDFFVVDTVRETFLISQPYHLFWGRWQGCGGTPST